MILLPTMRHMDLGSRKMGKITIFFFWFSITIQYYLAVVDSNRHCY